MAGLNNPNLPTFLLSANQRAVETPAADWTDGMNRGGSCAPGVGINTGDYSPKPSDWPEIQIAPAQSQQIGFAAENVTADQDPDFNDTLAFVQADAQTAPGGVLDVGTGAINQTGKTVPAGAWVWGTVPVV